jgi:large subunit ribosomal protein L3
MGNKNPGLLGRKIGMTQLYADDGAFVPVTVVDTKGNTVISVKTEDSADGYSAIQLGFSEKKAHRTTKAEAGHFAKAGVTPKSFVRELRLSTEEAAKYEVGSELNAADIFELGQRVDVTGTSKGRGFAGVFKRHNFAGFIRTHGTHEFFRHGGSIGTRLTPGHVLKGKKMPGQMGAERKTVENLEVVKVDGDKGLVFIKGGVPGPNGGYLFVRHGVKG